LLALYRSLPIVHCGNDAELIVVSLPLLWQRCQFFLDKASPEAIKMCVLFGKAEPVANLPSWCRGLNASAIRPLDSNPLTRNRGSARPNALTEIQGQEIVNGADAGFCLRRDLDQNETFNFWRQ
jgi:hypothetical protein